MTYEKIQRYYNIPKPNDRLHPVRNSANALVSMERGIYWLLLPKCGVGPLWAIELFYHMVGRKFSARWKRMDEMSSEWKYIGEDMNADAVEALRLSLPPSDLAKCAALSVRYKALVNGCPIPF
jgi:hypothetical protein